MATEKQIEPGKCAHENCDCPTGPDEHFCSDYCVRASELHATSALLGDAAKKLKCHCGHPDCA